MGQTPPVGYSGKELVACAERIKNDRVTHWMPQYCECFRGRLEKRWRDNLNILSAEWPEMAGDRNTWKEMEKVLPTYYCDRIPVAPSDC